MKKIFSILLIGVIAFGLTGCGNNTAKNDSKDTNSNSKENVQTLDNNKNIKKFLNAINSKDFDKASNLLDKERINELLKMDLPNEDFSKSLDYAFNDESNTINYDIDSIKKISKDELLNEISKMDENEIIKNRKDIIDLFDDYDLYIVDCTLIYNEDKINLHDVLFINNDSSKLTGSAIIDGLIKYYYSAVYNRPNR